MIVSRHVLTLDLHDPTRLLLAAAPLAGRTEFQRPDGTPWKVRLVHPDSRRSRRGAGPPGGAARHPAARPPRAGLGLFEAAALPLTLLLGSLAWAGAAGWLLADVARLGDDFRTPVGLATGVAVALAALGVWADYQQTHRPGSTKCVRGGQS